MPFLPRAAILQTRVGPAYAIRVGPAYAIISIVWEGRDGESKPPVIDAALALGRLTGLTGKDEVIWLRACLEACTLRAGPPE